MKKIFLIVLTGLLLVGCSSAHLESYSNEPLFTINGTTINEADVFNSMHLSAASLQVVRVEAQKILLNKLVEEDSDFDARISESLAEIKESLGDNYELFLSENGFENEADYVDQILKDSVKMDMLLTKMMNDDYESLKSFRPREVRIVEVDEKDAKAAYDLAKEGKDLEEVAKEYGKTASLYNGTPIIVSEKSSLNTEPLNALLNSTEPGLVDGAIPASSGTSHFILEVIELDADAIKDKAIESFIQDSSLTDSYIAKAFVDHGFKLHDQTLYDRFRENYPDYLK